jgi:hypothetical protein
VYRVTVWMHRYTNLARVGNGSRMRTRTKHRRIQVSAKASKRFKFLKL